MLFIFIAWLLTLVTFVIILRALHTIPIYVHTALEQQGQKLHLQTVFGMTQILLSVALTLLLLHFTLPNTLQHPADKTNTNSSVESENLSVAMDVYNASL